MNEFNCENKLQEVNNQQKQLLTRLKDILYIVESLNKEQKRIEETLLVLEGNKQILQEVCEKVAKDK